MIANENKAVFTKLINGSLVQVQLGEPNKHNPNQIFLIGDGFGLFVYFGDDTHFKNGKPIQANSRPRKNKKQT